MDQWRQPRSQCRLLQKFDEPVLGALTALPHAPVASHDEVLAFLETDHLMGRGLGWVDIHLLASAKLGRLPFWTLDKRLAAVVTALQLQS